MFSGHRSAWDFVPIPEEVAAQVSTNPKIRNGVAYAHEMVDGLQKHLAYIALIYPNRYGVTADQIEVAKRQLEQDKRDAIERLTDSGILLMVGMGSVRNTTDPDEIDNHRVRGEFKAPDGRLYFIEVSINNNHRMYCNHSVDRDAEKRSADPRYQKTYYNNCKGLERLSELGNYTKSRLLVEVFRSFGCRFTDVEIDSYTLGTEDYTSVSP